MFNDEKRKIDQAVKELEDAGITPEDVQAQKAGVGDMISSIFAKFGLSEDKVAQWAGVDSCGCNKRKQFLNKILSFRKRG